MEQQSEFEESRIERTKRGMSGLAAQEKPKSEVAELSASRTDVSTDWNDSTLQRTTRRRSPLGVKLLKLLLVIAVLATFGSGTYLLYSLWDPFCSLTLDRIDIITDIPVAVTPGISEDITAHITNKNCTGIENAVLTITYPAGTRTGAAETKDTKEEKKTFDAIDSGETVTHRTSAIFLGEENTETEVVLTLEFRFQGTNSTFTKSVRRPIKMLAAPINLTVKALKEVNAGQQLDFTIEALSNASIPLQNILVTMDFPRGFAPGVSNPAPTYGKSVWRIGTLEPGGKATIALSGVVTGIDLEEKVFTTSVGVSGENERELGTTYSRVVSSVHLIRPFIGIQLAMNGRPMTDALVPYGQSIEAKIDWQNNLPTRVVDGQIEVKLRGVGLNRRAIIAGNGGFYRSSDNTIYWDGRGDEELGILESEETGSVSFGFIPLPQISGGGVSANQEICADVTVRGKRYDENGVPEEVRSLTTQCAKISSSVQFASRALYSIGPFVNRGPIPPKAEQETTYTVTWNVVNTSNTIVGARARTVLPVYVEWARVIFPQNEKISYNEVTHEVLWDIGDVTAGTGIAERPPREASFQIIFTPSLSQVHTIPQLTLDTVFTGKDGFTGLPVEQNKNGLTTDLSTDPGVSREDSEVVP